MLRGSICEPNSLCEGPCSLPTLHFTESQWWGNIDFGVFPERRHRKQVPRLPAAAYSQHAAGSGKGSDSVQKCFLEQGADKRWLVLKFQMNCTVGYKNPVS